MALLTGIQLRAGRVLAALEQKALAEAAGVNVNTIRRLEAFGSSPIDANTATVRKVQSALEAAGVEFTNGDAPGVRLRKGS